MHIFKSLFLHLISTVPTLATASRNLTSLASNTALPYPKGYSMQTCPASGNAWSSTQSPKHKVRSFAESTGNHHPSSNNSDPFLITLDSHSAIPIQPSKRQQSSSPLCNGIARQNFNYDGVGSGYQTRDILLQAGIQYVVSFSSNNPVLGMTLFQEAVGTALSHVVSRPNFAHTASGTLTFTLKQAANVWMVMKFANGMPAQGQLGIFAFGTPSDLNLEAGSGGLLKQ